MLKHGEINPLNVFGLRRLDHCPPHFEQIKFDLYTDIKDISDWIWENLTGRFYLGDSYVFDPGSVKQLDIRKIAGFEIVEEASIFGLWLPTINRIDFDSLL